MTLLVGLGVISGGAITAAAVPASQRRPLPVVVVALLLASGTVYFSDTAYADPSASVFADSRLADRISFERVVSTVFWGGGARAGIGAIELHNEDGALDGLLLSAPRGAQVQIFLGDDETAWGDMHCVATAMIDQPESIGEDRIRLPVLDTSSELRRSVLTSNFTSGTLLGKPRPVLIGRGYSIPAQLSNFADSLWSISDVIPEGITAVRDKGYELTPTTQWLAANDGEHVGFELLQSRVGRVTCDADGGDFLGAALPSHTLAGMVGALLVDRAGMDMATEIDVAGMSALAAELSAGPEFGLFIDKGLHVDQALDRIVDSFAGWWYRDLDGVVRIDRLRLPSGDPVLDISESELKGDVSITLDTAPGLCDRVDARPNWHVHSPDELAASVLETEAAVLLQQTYRISVPFEVADIYQDARGADRPSQHTLIVDQATADAEATRRAALWNGPRWWVEFSAELSVLEAVQLLPGQGVRLTLPRFGFDAGTELLVTEVAGEFGDREVRIKAWAPLEWEPT